MVFSLGIPFLHILEGAQVGVQTTALATNFGNLPTSQGAQIHHAWLYEHTGGSLHIMHVYVHSYIWSECKQLEQIFVNYPLDPRYHPCRRCGILGGVQVGVQTMNALRTNFCKLPASQGAQRYKAWRQTIMHSIVTPQVHRSEYK